MQGQGTVKPLSYLEARNSSILYMDNELHARVIMLLFSCMLTQEGTALRTTVVTPDARTMSARNIPHTESASWNESWGEGMFEGFIASARSAHGSGRSGGGGGGMPESSLDAANNTSQVSMNSKKRSMAGPLREAERNDQSATLQRFMSGKSFRTTGTSLRHLVGRASTNAMSAASSATATAAMGVGASNRSKHALGLEADIHGLASPWENLESHPVYVLQCHLNHPGNLVLVNVQVGF